MFLNAHISKPLSACQNYSNLEFQNFSGGGPLDSAFRERSKGKSKRVYLGKGEGKSGRERVGGKGKKGEETWEGKERCEEGGVSNPSNKNLPLHRCILASTSIH